MSEPAQSYAKHARMVPMYHYVASPLIFVPVLYFLKEAITAFSVENVMNAAFGVGVVLAAFYARAFPLGVQDRLIRLEERLRMERVLPEDLRARIEDVTTDQLVGLRFAPDDELEGLTRRVLAGELADRKSIKQAVRSWRADHQRI